MPSSADGLTRLRALADELPDQLRQGFALGKALDPPIPPATRAVGVVGMGGSAIAGDLLRGLLDAESEVAIATIRSPAPPRWLSERGAAIFASYSGHTWETLAAYEAAGRTGVRRVVLTSGGELAERADRDGVPSVVIPTGRPPRAAIGHLLGALLGIVDPLLPESIADRLERATRRLAQRAVDLAARRGSVARLADALGRRRPYFLASAEYEGLARRWAGQVEENAKRLAEFAALSEPLHNALVAWDTIDRSLARQLALVVLAPRPLDGRIAAGARHLERVAARRGAFATEVRLGIDDRLEALICGIAFGDRLSLAMAERARIDPIEIRAIDRMKRSTASRSSRRAA